MTDTTATGDDAAGFDVCVMGSANLDLVARAERLPAPGETVMGTDFAEHPGGKGLNQAVAAARAGASVAFVGAVGDDNAGDVLLGVLSSDRVDAAGVRRVAAPTGRALIGVSADAENSIIVVPGANALSDATATPHCRVMLVQLEVPIGEVAIALRRGRAIGARTVLNPAPAADLAESLIAMCDVIVPNEHEVGLLGGVRRLLAAGAGAVVVTRGGDGVDVHTANGMQHVEPYAVVPVDSTGAGDSFCGALAARLAAGDDLPSAVQFAAAGGALATTRHGAVPSIPTRTEIVRLMEGPQVEGASG
jgi:ribokinase